MIFNNLSDIKEIIFNNQDVQHLVYNDVEIWSKSGDVPVHDYSLDYFTIELLESGSFLWRMYGSGASYTIEYSKNDGEWISATSTSSGVVITGNTGDTFRFRGNNVRYAANNSSYNRNYSYFDLTVRCNAYGNIMSLIYGDTFAGKTLTAANTYAFCSLFKPYDTVSGSKLIDASELILPVGLSTGCFRAMFAASKNMTTGPKEVRLAEGGNAAYVCYYMFQDCDMMSKSPDLPTISYSGNYAYQRIFDGCNILNSVKCLLSNPTFTTTGTCYRMFSSIGVSNGTFYKNPSATWPSNSNGVPAGWTIIDI